MIGASDPGFRRERARLIRAVRAHPDAESVWKRWCRRILRPSSDMRVLPRLFLGVFIAIITLVVSQAKPEAVIIVGAVGIMIACHYATTLREQVASGGIVGGLRMLPVDDPMMAQELLRYVMPGWMMLLVGVQSASIVMVSLDYGWDHPRTWLCALLVGVAQMSTVGALVFIIVRWIPPLFAAILTYVIAGLLGVALAFRKDPGVSDAVHGVLISVSSWVPVGVIIRECQSEGLWWLGLGVLMVIATWIVWRVGYRHMVSEFRLEFGATEREPIDVPEIEDRRQNSQLPAPMTSGWVERDDSSVGTPTPDDRATCIQALKEARQQPTFRVLRDQGWFGRLLIRVLRPEHDPVVELLRPKVQIPRSSWITLLIMHGVAAAAVFMIPVEKMELTAWVFPLLLGYIGLAWCPILGGAWQGFGDHEDSKQPPSMYQLPISVATTVSVMWRINAMRMFVVAPICALSSMVMALHPLVPSVEKTVRVLMGCWCLLFVLQPLLVTMISCRLLRVRMDLEWYYFFVIVLATVIAAPLAVLAILSVSALFTQSIGVTAIAAVILWLVSWSMVKSVLWAYRRGWFDIA